jgi:hypothetical protein
MFKSSNLDHRYTLTRAAERSGGLPVSPILVGMITAGRVIQHERKAIMTAKDKIARQLLLLELASHLVYVSHDSYPRS